jgi:hypothetical protein
MQRKVVTPSTSTRKRRLKSLFRYSTMKQLEKSRDDQQALRTSIPFNEFEVLGGSM